MFYYEVPFSVPWRGWSQMQSAVLPYYELSEQVIKEKGARIRPFDPKRGFTGDPALLLSGDSEVPKLSITDWELFHAAKKSELAQSFSAEEARLHTLATSVLYHSLFDWVGENLALYAST